MWSDWGGEGGGNVGGGGRARDFLQRGVGETESAPGIQESARTDERARAQERAERGTAVKDEEVEEVLKRATRAAHEVEPALLKRVADSIHSSLQPVRPLPPTWVLTGPLVLMCAAVAVAGAA